MPTRSLSNGGIRKILRTVAQGVHVDSFTRVDDSSGNPICISWGSPQRSHCIDFFVRLSILCWTDDSEFAAQMHQPYHVEQAVVITPLARWDLRYSIPLIRANFEIDSPSMGLDAWNGCREIGACVVS